MSADNAIFILDHPAGFGVVHHTMSGMPYDICGIFHTRKTCYGDLDKKGGTSPAFYGG
jgi:hypothetical protein